MSSGQSVTPFNVHLPFTKTTSEALRAQTELCSKGSNVDFNTVMLRVQS